LGDDVHIQPRAHPAAPKEPDIDPAFKTHTKPMKVQVDMVLVPVTITDPLNRLVTGLDRDNFNLFEGKDQQEIKTFSSEDAPVSIGVIFDMSGSMSSKIERAREAVVEFFKTANPQDEFFMIAFSDKPEEIADFTSSVDEIQGRLLYTVPRGRTALLDAIYLGVTKMRQAKYPKKALLIISDGAPGLITAIEQAFPKALRQRCLIHRARNILAKVPAGMQAEVKDAYWAIFDTEEVKTPPGPKLTEIIDARITEMAARYAATYPSAMKCLLADREGLTAYLRFPAEHHHRIRHSNFIERTFGETRRRTKVIGRLPGETSCLTLVWAVLDRASRG